ncbi:DUF4412 domain-containing protein [Desulfobacterales bacterium HSG17]|nr:DUF4412 domain-containing protein [Desulfobacterales bacterium HSG17]
MKSFIITIVFCLTITFAAAAEFSADMITEMAGVKDRGRIYYKNVDISRIEVMGGIINISKRPLVYQLFSDTKKYYITDIRENKKNTMADVRTIKEWIEKNELKKTGTKKISGFDCSIYEGKVKYAQDQPPVPSKIWFSENLEYPVRTESTLSQPMGTIVNYLENIKPGKQAADKFEIPSGYKKAKSIEEAMGMMNINAAPPLRKSSNNAGPQKMPSQKDMEKMMKQMQKMQEMMEQGKQQ